MTNETLNMVIAAIIIPLAGVLIPYLCSFISKKNQELKDKINDAKISKYLDIAEDAIQTAVISTYQTFVSKIKGTDGWTENVQKQAFEEAKMKALVIMGTAAKEALQALYDDFDTWLSGKIEACVYIEKRDL